MAYTTTQKWNDVDSMHVSVSLLMEAVEKPLDVIFFFTQIGC